MRMLVVTSMPSKAGHDQVHRCSIFSLRAGPTMGSSVVVAFFNLCVNCVRFHFFSFLFLDVYEGECAGPRRPARSSVSLILELFSCIWLISAVASGVFLDGFAGFIQTCRVVFFRM